MSDDPTEDTSLWAIVHSRFRDPLDMIAAACPDEPFVQEMLATRERIRRRHEEIMASVPEGLSPRQRDEYVAASVMGSIVSDTDTEGGTP